MCGRRSPYRGRFLSGPAAGTGAAEQQLDHLHSGRPPGKLQAHSTLYALVPEGATDPSRRPDHRPSPRPRLRRLLLGERHGVPARQPGDYDQWAELGARGWSYGEVLPYFWRMEHRSGGQTDRRPMERPAISTVARTPLQSGEAGLLTMPHCRGTLRRIRRESGVKRAGLVERASIEGIFAVARMRSTTHGARGLEPARNGMQNGRFGAGVGDSHGASSRFRGCIVVPARP